MSNITLSKLLRNISDYHTSAMEEHMIDDIRGWVTANLPDASDDAVATLLRDAFETNKGYLNVDYGCDVIVDHIISEVLNPEYS